MKLLIFTPIEKSPVLFNTGQIKLSSPDGEGSRFSYGYLGDLITVRITEGYEAFLNSIGDTRGFNVESLTLSVLSIDNRMINTQVPLCLKYILRGETNSLGTLLYCSGEAVSLAQKLVKVQVSETLEEIVSLQAPVTPLVVKSVETNSYPLSLLDAEKYIRLSDATEVAVTIPLNSDTPFKVGTSITLEQSGVGAIIVAGGAEGVVVNGPTSSPGQYKVITLIKVDTDTWTCIGGTTNE